MAKFSNTNREHNGLVNDRSSRGRNYVPCHLRVVHSFHCLPFQCACEMLHRIKNNGARDGLAHACAIAKPRLAVHCRVWVVRLPAKRVSFKEYSKCRTTARKGHRNRNVRVRLLRNHPICEPPCLTRTLGPIDYLLGKDSWFFTDARSCSGHWRWEYEHPRGIDTDAWSGPHFLDRNSDEHISSRRNPQ